MPTFIHLFLLLARINHDCVPNSRKFFTSDKRMIVVASRDIKAGKSKSKVIINHSLLSLIKVAKAMSAFNLKFQ